VPFIHSQLREAQARRNPGKLPCPFVLPYVFVVRKNSFALIEKKTSQSAKRKKVSGFALFENFLCGSAKGGSAWWDFTDSFLRGEKKNSNTENHSLEGKTF